MIIFYLTNSNTYRESMTLQRGGHHHTNDEHTLASEKVLREASGDTILSDTSTE